MSGKNLEGLLRSKTQEISLAYSLKFIFIEWKNFLGWIFLSLELNINYYVNNMSFVGFVK